MQANRYRKLFPPETSGPLDNLGMETKGERRLRKLRLVCANNHGFAAVAIKAGLKPVYLQQILSGVKLPPKKGDGSRSERQLGDRAVQAIEDAFPELGRGWFDSDEEGSTMTARELLMLGYFRSLKDEALQDLIIQRIKETVEQRAEIAVRLVGPISATTLRQTKSH